MADRPRGPKAESLEKFFARTSLKINYIKNILKNSKKTGLPVTEKARLRNVVSAQQSRIKKREEANQLKTLLKDQNEKISKLKSILSNQGLQKYFDKIFI